jgi:hypothetical protein
MSLTICSDDTYVGSVKSMSPASTFSSNSDPP